MSLLCVWIEGHKVTRWQDLGLNTGSLNKLKFRLCMVLNLIVILYIEGRLSRFRITLKGGAHSGAWELLVIYVQYM